VAVAAFAGGAQASFSGVHWASTIQRDVPAELLGRVNAFDSIGALVLAPAGYAATGLVAGAVGTAPVLWFGAAWAAVSAAVAVSLPAVRAVRAEPAVEPQPAATTAA
jgi:hypothetical protein